MVKKACSTLDAFLADVSRKGMPRLSANSWLRALARGAWLDERAEDAYLCDVVLNDLLVSHIALVADEKLVNALGSVAVNLLQPLLDVVE